MKTYLPLFGYITFVVSFLPAAFAEKPKAPVTFDYPDQRSPGCAKAIVQGKTRTLQNDLVSFQFDVTEGRVTNARFDIPGEAGSTVVVDEPFSLIVDGKPINASALKLDTQIPEETTSANTTSPRLGDHDAAKSFALTFTAPDDSYRVVWKPILRDGSNYIVFDVTITPLRGDLSLNRLVMLDVTAKNLKQLGTPAGSPVVNDRFFFGFHHPLIEHFHGCCKIRTVIFHPNACCCQKYRNNPFDPQHAF